MATSAGRHAAKLLGPPSLWMVVADYNLCQPAIQPLLDTGKIKEVIHGNSVSDFEGAFKSLSSNTAKNADNQLVFAMNSPKAPEVLKPLLQNAAWKKDLVWVHSLFTGVDAFQLQKFDQKLFEGVQISNAYGVFGHILAEHCMYAILYFLRKTTLLQKNQENRVWNQTTYREMRHLKMGIIGYGNIGSEVASMARRGFDMTNLQGWNLAGTGEVDAHGVKVVGGADGLADTLATSDIILNVLPKTNETRQFVNKDAFAKMKKTAIFLSIGRGWTVCEADLADALNEDRIAAAALDVYENEPLSKESPLYSVKDMSSKLLLTPHDADLALNKYFPATKQFGEYLETFVDSGGNLDHVHHWVDPSKGY